MDTLDFEKNVTEFFKEQFGIEVLKFSIEKDFMEAGMRQLIGKAETSVQTCWIVGNEEGIIVYSEVSGNDAESIYKFHKDEIVRKEVDNEEDGFILGEKNIDEDFVKAVGRLTINFAHLEFVFSLCCGSKMGAPNPINEIITSELSFKQLLNITASIFQEIEKDKERLSKFNEIVSQSYQLEQSRNTIIHSFYGQKAKGDGVIIRQKTTAKGKKGFKRHYEEMNAKAINAIADKMDEVSKELGMLLFTS